MLKTIDLFSTKGRINQTQKDYIIFPKIYIIHIKRKPAAPRGYYKKSVNNVILPNNYVTDKPLDAFNFNICKNRFIQEIVKELKLNL